MSSVWLSHSPTVFRSLILLTFVISIMVSDYQVRVIEPYYSDVFTTSGWLYVRYFVVGNVMFIGLNNA